MKDALRVTLLIILALSASSSQEESLGRRDYNESVNRDLIENQSGLYVLGTVSTAGKAMFCANGIFETMSMSDRGQLFFYVMRNGILINGTRGNRIRVRQQQDDNSGRCSMTTPEVECGDMVLVYIPNRCANCTNPRNALLTCCPLQVVLNNSSTTVVYYNGSDGSNSSNPDRIVNESITEMQLVNKSLDLNVFVNIMKEEEESTTTSSTTIDSLSEEEEESTTTSSTTIDSTNELLTAEKKGIIAILVILFIFSIFLALGCWIFCWKKKVKARKLQSRNDLSLQEVHTEPENSVNQSRKHSEPNIYGSSMNGDDSMKQTKKGAFSSNDYSLIKKERLGPDMIKEEDNLDDHDYEEPYFEPASEEEGLLLQLKKMSIPMILEKELRIHDFLGSGAFGTVHRGVWSHSGGGSDQVAEEEVAVKSMEIGAKEEERVKFLQEAAIMGQFNHPNIVRILGIIEAEKNLKIMVELMKKGDLRKHLIDIRPSPNEPVPPELAPTLLSFSRQVASGMVYLAVKSFIHRDLAARNVLVSEDGVCKIADFGLSRDLQDANYYVSHGGKIPVKWTAPEALHYHKYSTASDVWSYGCVLYEIWSLGVKPFHDATNAEAMKKINAGFRLPPPPGCPRTIYEAMIQCWQPDATERPEFMDIMIPLQRPDFRILDWTSEEISMYSKEARTLGEALDAGHRLHMDLQRIYISNMNQNSEKKQKTDKQQSRSPKNSDHGLEIKSLVVESKDDPESDGYELEKETSADQIISVLKIESPADKTDDSALESDCYDQPMGSSAVLLQSNEDPDSDGYV